MKLATAATAITLLTSSAQANDAVYALQSKIESLRRKARTNAASIDRATFEQPADGTCTNDPNFEDSWGDDCSWYEEFDPQCQFADCCDIGKGTARTACCICNGNIPSTPAPVTPAPVTPAPVTPAPVPPPGSASLQDAIDLLDEAAEILEGLL